MCLPIAVTLLTLPFTVIIRLSLSNQILLTHMCTHSFIEPAKTWQVSKGEWGYIYPCHLRGFYPTLHNSHLPLFTHRPLQYVTTFTCIWFCFNLYVLDKRKRAIEKSLKEKVPQQPSNCNPPTPPPPKKGKKSVAQLMAIHGRTNKNQTGTMLLAFNSSPKSFQLLT